MAAWSVGVSATAATATEKLVLVVAVSPLLDSVEVAETPSWIEPLKSAGGVLHIEDVCLSELGVFRLEAEDASGLRAINAKAAVTVVLASDLGVKASHAVEDAKELNVDAILKDIGKIVE